MLIFLTACGGDKEKSSEEETKEPEMVKVVIPSIYFDGVPDEQIIAEAEELGIEETSIGEDKRDVTYVMTKEKQEELVQGLEENLKEFFNYVLKTLSSFQAIDYDEGFEEITVSVNKENYLQDGNVEAFGTLGILQRTRYYHYFKGKSEEDIYIRLVVKDEETDEIIEEIIYPDDIEGE